MASSAFGLSEPTGLSAARLLLPSESERPSFDLEAWLILQKGNLAVAEEVRALVADAVGEIARTQCRYLERTVRSPVPAVGASAHWGLALSTAEEVIGHALDAQREIGELLARCLRVNLAELTTL